MWRPARSLTARQVDHPQLLVLAAVEYRHCRSMFADVSVAQSLGPQRHGTRILHQRLRSSHRAAACHTESSAVDSGHTILEFEVVAVAGLKSSLAGAVNKRRARRMQICVGTPPQLISVELSRVLCRPLGFGLSWGKIQRYSLTLKVNVMISISLCSLTPQSRRSYFPNSWMGCPCLWTFAVLQKVLPHRVASETILQNPSFLQLWPKIFYHVLKCARIRSI